MNYATGPEEARVMPTSTGPIGFRLGWVCMSVDECECEQDGGEDNAEVLSKKGSLEQRTYSKTFFFLW